MTEIWGITPEAKVFLRKISAYPARLPTPSCILAPPESLRPIRGAPFFIANSITLHIFSATVKLRVPPNTVKSWANTKTSLSLIFPYPVTTPSPRNFLVSMPKSLHRWVTKRSSSTKVPLSRRRSSLSLAVSFPASCCFSIRFLPPPKRASRFFPSSSFFISLIPIGYFPPFTGITSSDLTPPPISFQLWNRGWLFSL